MLVAGSLQWRVPGANGWRKVDLEDFCQAVDKDEVLKSMVEVMDHPLKFMDAAIFEVHEHCEMQRESEGTVRGKS